MCTLCDRHDHASEIVKKAQEDGRPMTDEETANVLRTLEHTRPHAARVDQGRITDHAFTQIDRRAGDPDECGYQRAPYCRQPEWAHAYGPIRDPRLVANNGYRR